MNDDLASYLLARLDEDEQVAQATRPHGLKPAVWGVEPWYDGTEERCDLRDYPLGDLTFRGGLEVTTAAHIARWDPARVLAEVEAKRRIVEHHLPERPDLQKYEPQACAVCVYDNAGTELFPCPTLRLLAQPYAEREDFRQEWRA